mmetsp:Transcript_1321/g.3079  ORF Transcript_1321/g.3079 Transcript_1321/m.3079 type:complete len:221 (-) Transcript_1321:2-664(-)
MLTRTRMHFTKQLRVTLVRRSVVVGIIVVVGLLRNGSVRLDLQDAGQLRGALLLEDIRVLHTRVFLDEEVLTELVQEILLLVHGERVIVATEQIPHLALLQGNLRRRPTPRVRVRAVHAEPRSVHVVLVPALDRGGVERTPPPEEHTRGDHSSMMQAEHMLTSHKVLRPEELPEWSTTQVREGQPTSNRTPGTEGGDELLGLDIPRQYSSGHDCNNGKNT